jgi:hypothetical protein
MCSSLPDGQESRGWAAYLEASLFYTGSQNSGLSVSKAELGNFDEIDTVAAYLFNYVPYIQEYRSVS